MEIQKNCKCGKEHTFSSEVMIGEGMLKEIPQILKKYNTKKVFFLADKGKLCYNGRKL